jgi:beta-galactosidase
MPRTRISLDSDWKFHLGDDLARSRKIIAKGGTANGWSDLTQEERAAANVPETIVESMGRKFQAVKLRPSSMDAEWQAVNLPHDWRLTMKPSPDHPEADDYPRSWQGFFPSGVAYYRKLLDIAPLNEGQHATITFDGIAGFSDIWLNGFWIGQQSTNYSPLTVDITELVRPPSAGPNILLVRTDSTEAEGWWYEGGGIYRHVWLDTYDDFHLTADGFHLRTLDVTDLQATISFQAQVHNRSAHPLAAIVEVMIKDASSNLEIARSKSPGSHLVPSYGSAIVSGEIQISNPKLWRLGKGGLYIASANLLDEKSTIRDTVSTPFGVRTIEWQDGGIVVNGEFTKIYGANIHQDWAVFGVALPDRVIEQKLELCAEMGVNAVRTAHHPPTPELVDHADRMGMLLLLEQRTFSTSEPAITQVRSLVRRFRNRPSVLMWGIENEEMDFQGSPVGHTILTRLVREIKALDPDRPTIFGGVVAFENAAYYNTADVVGMHYRSFFGVIDESIAYVPNKHHVLDEEGLYPSTRGVYEYDKQRAHAGSLSTLRDVMMDTDSPAANAALMPVNFKITGNIAATLTTAYKHPKLSGVFVWTALDYIGEPTPQRWPATTSSYGGRDLCGIPKDYYWLLRSIMRCEPIVHAFPHWTWPGREGKKMPMRAYTNCDTVEIIVNGTVVCRTPAKDGLVITSDEVEYQPGELLVRGYISDQLVAEHLQVTSGPPARLVLQADRTTLASSGLDVGFVRVAVTDEMGNLIHNAALSVRFEVKGAGHLIGSHNADPSTDEYTSRSSTVTFNGFVGVYVRAAYQPGELVLTALSDFPDVSVIFDVSDSEPQHAVHVAANEAEDRLFGLHRSL